MENKDFVHIVIVTYDTFAQPEIIPTFEIILCEHCFISIIQNLCGLCGENISIIISIFLQ